MTAPDVLRSMAAHPSSQRPKIVHVACLTTGRKFRLCGTPAPARTLPLSEIPGRQLCVVCEELAMLPCRFCGGVHADVVARIRGTS